MIIFRKILLLLTVLGISGGLLVGIARIQTNMETIITEKKLMDTNMINDASPLVAFTTIALGSFRGLLVDYLWLRANRQQEEGQYFELRQLASWITQLQPRFTGATSHLAWNMAYNISVTFSFPQDRWRWVKNGLELIRDEALIYNPSDPKLYKELGWIYQHKIGNIMDDANYFYKIQVAREMQTVTGSSNPNFADLALIPLVLEEFETHFIDGESLKSLLRIAGYDDFAVFEKKFRMSLFSQEELTDILGDGKKNIEQFLRVRWMHDVLKMDPKVINDINLKFGKLDWRLPESHAIYWAWQGLMHSRGGRNIDCERMITQCLAVAFSAGRMISMDQEGEALPVVLTLPNLAVADSVKREYERAYAMTKISKFLTARENFMLSAITQFYVFGRYSKAQEYLDILRKEFPHKKKYKLKMDNFAKIEWVSMVQNATPKEASSLIAGQIYQSCMLLAFGENDGAASFEKMAQFIHTYYSRQQQSSAGRMGLLNYGQLKTNIVKNCLKVFPKDLSENLRFAIESMPGSVQ